MTAEELQKELDKTRSLLSKKIEESTMWLSRCMSLEACLSAAALREASVGAELIQSQAEVKKLCGFRSNDSSD